MPRYSRPASSRIKRRRKTRAAWPKPRAFKTLVLSHFVPPDDPDVTDQDAARVHFCGPLIVGKDLLEV
jgi:hypothetical protein